ncbi:unnamed protein product [Hymenolepis diminuta]|uniref:CRAL-TRIO domain-containing protein n=4 Tax=Hymenolepis diminuta TaxID=6216 RepID=A0A0R3SUR1_HYMDI|nr:unnamed protein product [Hymenolepis diminuta]VUZ51399.1 unnamed protein product [Hymenolepis diminuta]
MACSSTSEQKLSSKYRKLAKTNLGEDFKNDPAHCEAMRRWLSSMPHLTCPTDDDFLLMFLRQSKFAHAKAQARLDNFCTLSTTKCIGDYIWATPVDLKSKRLEYYLNIGLHVPLGYMEDGKMVVAVRPRVLNQEEMNIAEAFSFAYKVLFMVNSDPRALIGGVVVILDATGSTSKNVISDPNTIRAMIRFVQEALPGRAQRMIFYNEGKFMDAMLSVFTFYMKDKMRNRMLRCGPDIKVALEAEPGLKAVLPSDIGGDGKSYKELVEENKKNFYAFYADGDKTGEIKVDESKRPSSAKDFLREYKDYDANVMGKSGTYIKRQDEI